MDKKCAPIMEAALVQSNNHVYLDWNKLYEVQMTGTRKFDQSLKL